METRARHEPCLKQSGPCKQPHATMQGHPRRAVPLILAVGLALHDVVAWSPGQYRAGPRGRVNVTPARSHGDSHGQRGAMAAVRAQTTRAGADNSTPRTAASAPAQLNTEPNPKEHMMALPRITAEGNLTADPEYRQTRNGKTVASFRLAANESRYNEQTRQWEQTGACYLQCTAWPPLSDNMYATGLAKGSPVIVTGRLETRTWQTEQGESRSRIELIADTIGPDLRRGTARFTKTSGGQNNTTPTPPQAQGAYQGGATYTGQPTDPFTQPANNGIRDDDPWAQPTNPGNEAEPEF
ncbi:single-stranded DNA-binding protein [Bifidobacterium animalis]|uniref:single-stranded DNA-binding protein n=1 Tax=Bifidobacterium animalis TaxID=28025 RepID=UPI001C3EAA4F|nr:single-stranded DNA-binding protein [Bifidobacterium animalis]MCR1995713.1 single-stranded DNA-binding protein [Bifidobacterium animalis subsp. animalis]